MKYSIGSSINVNWRNFRISFKRELFDRWKASKKCNAIAKDYKILPPNGLFLTFCSCSRNTKALPNQVSFKMPFEAPDALTNEKFIQFHRLNIHLHGFLLLFLFVCILPKWLRQLVPMLPKKCWVDDANGKPLKILFTSAISKHILACCRSFAMWIICKLQK